MAEAKANDFLEKEGLGKLMAKYCIPCVISLLVATLYNIVDQLFIANADYLGSYGNAANSVVFPLTVIALGLGMMIGDGCCAFVSISLGANKKDTARRTVGTSVTSLVILGIALMLLYLIFQDQIMTLYGARVNQETFDLAKEYFFWISLGIPFYMFGQAMNPIVRSDGSPRFAMVTLLTGAVLNIILDPIFIFVCRWGMKGAALATIIGQIVAALMFVGYLFRLKIVKLDRDAMKPRASILKKCLPLGAASLLTQVSIALSMAVVLNMLKKYGALDPVFSQEQYSHIPTAVVGIVMKFFQITMSVAIGLATGCIPIAGYNVGARKYDRVRALMRLLLIAQAVVGVIATVIFLGFPYQLTGLFGGASESVYYVEYSVKCIRVFMCMSILSCINKGVAIYQQALGNARTATVLSLLREILFGVTLPVILPIFMGLDGVLWFMPISDIVVFIVSIFVIVRTNRQFSDEAAQRELSAESESAAPIPANPGAKGGVVTIGRAYGAGGRSVGKLVAEKLGVPYYDSALLEQAAVNSGLSRKYLESVDEKSAKLGAIYRYTSLVPNPTAELEQTAVTAQREIIERVAAEGPCVIVGRRADQILTGKTELFRVFVTAPLDARVKRVMQRERLSRQESAQKIKKADKERSAYYNQHSEQVWGAASSYDLCVDTERIGVQGCADLIVAAVQGLDT